MNSYRVVYRDLDPACPEFHETVKAHDKEAAILSFIDSCTTGGWIILRLARISTRPIRLWDWDQVNLTVED